jgi:hypothetical protein
VIGRFVSADSVVPATYNPQALNRYSYCVNNPLLYIDPSGHNWFYFQNNWFWHEGDKYTYKDTEGKEQTITSSYEMLVTYEMTGTNSEGASVGTLRVYGNDKGKEIFSVSGAFTGGMGFDGIEKGNYMMRLDIRNAGGPTEMNANKTNPSPHWGIQLIPNRYLYETDENGIHHRYDVGGGYGGGRIRLNQVDENLNIISEQKAGYYLHGKYQSHNWTHDCVCDKTEKVFDYFWNGAGSTYRSYIPFWVK